MSKPVLISLYDYTGNWSRPYLENGWDVIQVDIQHGYDVLDFNIYSVLKRGGQFINTFGLLAAQPCTDYATCGAKHFKEKDLDGRTKESQKLVAATKRIVDFLNTNKLLKFWALENPKSRIHKLNPWLGDIKHKFNPCDYAGYDPQPKNSQYNKETWLWGNFNIPKEKYLSPLQKDYPGFSKLGGKSLATKNARSITPLGFAYAFYSANH
jgi:hypothetical protein